MTSYAFLGSGQLQLNKHFAKLTALDQDPGIRTIDTTNAICVNMDVRFFNYKLGLIKATNNVDISTTNTKYDVTKDCFPTKNAVSGEWEFPADPYSATNTSTFTITPTEFVSNIVSSNQFTNLGKFDEIYLKFQERVNQYFNWSAGFSTLFAQGDNYTFTATTGDVDDTTKKLTNQGMYNLLTSTTPATLPDDQNYIETVTNSLQVIDVNTSLRNVVDKNQFNNRTSKVPINSVFNGTVSGLNITGITITSGAIAIGQVLSGTGITAGTSITSITTTGGVITSVAIDKSHATATTTTITGIMAKHRCGSDNGELMNESGTVVIATTTSFGVWDGFIHGDYIYFPEGISCNVKLTINEAVTNPLNFVNQAIVSGVIQSHTSLSVTSTNTQLPNTFTTNEGLVTYNVVAPLLIRLVDVKDTAPAVDATITRDTLIPADGWGTALATSTTSYSLANKSAF
jgi:hypothetical protein